MKYYLLAISGACLIGTLTAGADAQVSYRIDFLGDRALTINNNYGQPGTDGWHWGWDNLETPSDGRSEDATLGTSYPSPGGALKLLDDDDIPYRSSHLTYDLGERRDGSGTVLKAGGVVVARVKYNVTAGAGVGFGYSTSDGNHTGILGIKNGAVSITGWDNSMGVVEYDTNGAAAGNDTAVPGGNNGVYRTYGFGWSVDFVHAPPGYNVTRYDVWVLNRNDIVWSSNPADWTQIITDLMPRPLPSPNNAMPDANAIDGLATGVMIGSFGPGFGGFGRTASGDLDFDWLTMKGNTAGNYNVVINPWSADPPPLIPADFDHDGDVDSVDFAHLKDCTLGAAVPQNNSLCADARLDGDNDVDMDDFGIFQRCYSGANNAANASCAN